MDFEFSGISKDPNDLGWNVIEITKRPRVDCFDMDVSNHGPNTPHCMVYSFYLAIYLTF